MNNSLRCSKRDKTMRKVFFLLRLYIYMTRMTHITKIIYAIINFVRFYHSIKNFLYERPK
jgi:hypothetical protein